MKSQQERQTEANEIMMTLGDDASANNHPGMVRFAEILNNFVRKGEAGSGYMAITYSKRRIMYALYPDAARPSWVRVMSALQGPISVSAAI
jgi:hypothetical protein